MWCSIQKLNTEISVYAMLAKIQNHYAQEYTTIQILDDFFYNFQANLKDDINLKTFFLPFDSE